MKYNMNSDTQSLLEEYSKQTKETHNGEFFAYDNDRPYHTDNSCCGLCCEGCGEACGTGNCCGDACLAYCCCGC